MAGPIADLVLLRGLFTDTSLRPGTVLAAKILERDGPRGTLLLNGVRVPAQLPPELAAGAALRVRVTEATSERLLLQVLPPADPAASATPPPPTVGIPLPGGARFRVEEHEGGAGPDARGGGRRSIALRFDSPALGRLDFLIDLEPEAATATVGVAAGAADTVRSAANELRTGLAEATDRPATVRVEPRAESLDVRG
ncbi:MAG TPA: hypothetical protein VF529_16185 [Solirubrobacteraceae bacterium]|jgi:hypothetical protein